MKLSFISKKAIILFLGDTLFVWLSFFLANLIRTSQLNFYNFLYFTALTNYIFFFYIFDLYTFHTKPSSISYLAKYLLSNLLGFITLSSLAFFLPAIRAQRSVLGMGTLILLLLIYLWRIIFFYIFKKFISKTKNILIVGYGKAGNFFYNTIKNLDDFNIIGFLDDDPKKWGTSNSPTVIGGSEYLCNNEIIKKIDKVVVAITHLKSEKLLRCLLECKAKNIEVVDMPTIYEEITGKIPINHINDFWLVANPLLGVKKTIYNIKVKRFFDILFSSIGLFLTLPLWIIVPILIKLTSRGPVLFKQKRVGLNGKLFTSLKFRTMVTGKEKDRKLAGEVNDPRITKVGKFLRKFRIDEIPQLINVLKNDMSLIGPRALIPEEVEEFKDKIPYFELRHSIKPGITGWAQVNYKHGAKLEDGFEKLQYDLYYIKNLSPLLDFHIILRTIKVVLFGFGAR